MSEQLLAGTGKLMITPTFGAELSGFVARKEKCRGVHDPLYARALVLTDGKKKIALVAADLIGVDAGLLAKVRAKVCLLTDLEPSAVLVSATHTHSGPATLAKAFLGRVDPDYLEGLADNLAGAVYLANQNLEPVRVFLGEGVCRSVGKNRRKKEGPTDPQVLVLRLQGTKGPKALLVNYACHPVVLGPDNLLVTADYPYYLIRTLEQLYPGTEVIFFNGAAGDINTGHETAESIQGKSDPRRTFQEAERLGRILAGVVLAASENAVMQRSSPLRYRAEETSLPLEESGTAGFYREEAEKWQKLAVKLKRKGAAFGEYRQAEVWAEWARTMAELREAGKLEPAVKVELAAFALGEIEFTTLPGEFFHEFALMIKRARAPRPVFVLGYTNHNIGYVAPAAFYDKGGYEINEAYRYYGLPSRFPRGTGEKIVQVLLAMLELL